MALREQIQCLAALLDNPKKLYLGREELEGLKAYAETSDFVMGVGGAKSTFCGLRIYCLFDESHLSVGN